MDCDKDSARRCPDVAHHTVSCAVRLTLSKGEIVKDLVWATGLTLAGFCSALCPASVAAQGVANSQSNAPATIPADDYGVSPVSTNGTELRL